MTPCLCRPRNDENEHATYNTSFNRKFSLTQEKQRDSSLMNHSKQSYYAAGNTTP